jgi:hypothetical protein
MINSGGSRVVVERNGALNHRCLGMTDLPQAGPSRRIRDGWRS